MTRRVLPTCLAFIAAAAIGRTAERTAADKSGYTLWNPTPERLMREMSTDRPDITESPFTVDAGHLQLEMNLASFTHNRLDGVRSTELAWAPFNLRLGLTNDFEAGVFFDPFVEATEQPRGEARTRARGAGDTTARVKFNFWGNDHGPSALGVILDLKLPTARRTLGNGKVEGALTVPFTLELGGGWEAGVNTTLAAAHTGAGGYRAVWANTVTASRDLGENFGAFWELTSTAGDGAHALTFDTGVAWRFGRHGQLDAGVNLGVSRAAPDVTWFAGLSRRF